MVFNNGAVIPGRRPSIPKRKTPQVVKQNTVKPSVSIVDVVIADPPYYFDTEVIKVEVATEPTTKEIEDIKDDALNACPYVAAETIIPESPVEEVPMASEEESSPKVEDELEEEIEENEEDNEEEVEGNSLSNMISNSKKNKKNKKKNKKKSTAAYEPE
jgi:hypothetical protein